MDENQNTDQNRIRKNIHQKHRFKKTLVTGASILALLYASNGFELRDRVNNSVERMIAAGVDAVTVDVGEAAERFYNKIESTEDLSPYANEIKDVLYALHEALPPEEKVETLESLLDNSPQPVQQLITQSMYAIQPQEFKTRFIEGNIADMSEEAQAELRRNITTQYLEEKKEQLFDFLDDVRNTLRPIYENVRDAIGLYNIID